MSRRFPGICLAAKEYGAEKVFIPAPKYENPRQCPWCGGEVKNKRRRYCSDECRYRFERVTFWCRGRDAYSLRIEYRDNFTCQDCGEIHNYVNEHGMNIPVDDGQLEVHHIIPLSKGGGNEPENLITLCKRCHKERHKKMRESEAKE